MMQAPMTKALLIQVSLVPISPAQASITEIFPVQVFSLQALPAQIKASAT